MPKDKKEKKPKAAETVEDVEMADASPKVRFEVEWALLSFRAEAELTLRRSTAEGNESEKGER